MLTRNNQSKRCGAPVEQWLKPFALASRSRVWSRCPAVRVAVAYIRNDYVPQALTLISRRRTQDLGSYKRHLNHTYAQSKQWIELMVITPTRVLSYWRGTVFKKWNWLIFEHSAARCIYLQESYFRQWTATTYHVTKAIRVWIFHGCSHVNSSKTERSVKYALNYLFSDIYSSFSRFPAKQDFLTIPRDGLCFKIRQDFQFAVPWAKMSYNYITYSVCPQNCNCFKCDYCSQLHLAQMGYLRVP